MLTHYFVCVGDSYTLYCNTATFIVNIFFMVPLPPALPVIHRHMLIWDFCVSNLSLCPSSLIRLYQIFSSHGTYKIKPTFHLEILTCWGMIQKYTLHISDSVVSLSSFFCSLDNYCFENNTELISWIKILVNQTHNKFS